MKKVFLTYEEAKKYVRELKIVNSVGWVKYLKNGKKPNNIPTSPNKYYKNKGWVTWKDFLGNNKYLSYEELKTHIRNIGVIKNSKGWKKYWEENERPKNIHLSPNIYYKKEWKGWKDLLGINLRKKKFFLSYEEAKEVVQKLNIKTIKEYQRKYNKKITELNIPTNPNLYYKEFKSWFDWLGIGNENKIHYRYIDFLSYEESKEIIYKLNIKSRIEWEKIKKNLPINIPKEPSKYYKNKGWVDWYDFLGKTYLKYEEAKLKIKELNILSRRKYLKYKTKDLPSNPERAYNKKGWISWDDYLGINREKYWKKIFYTYEEAKEVVHKLNIKSRTEWKDKYCKRNDFNKLLPKDPERKYNKKGWVDWYDFLGINREEYWKKIFYTYEEAKKYMHNIGLKSEEEWKEYKKNGLKPEFIPSKPRNFYYGEFKGFMDFLGFKYVNPKMSRAEIKIKKFLIENNIRHIQEKIFDDCFYINHLPFDFYLPDYNILIEYDGEHHFMPIKLYGGQEYFELVQKKDKIKNEWAKLNNIKLIRIHYTDYKNINNILSDNFLK
jgi:hypothetical protein